MLPGRRLPLRQLPLPGHARLQAGGEDTALGEAAQGRQLLEQFDDATHHRIMSTFRPVNWS